jgi:hypothetical protein
MTRTSRSANTSLAERRRSPGSVLALSSTERGPYRFVLHQPL